MDREDSDGLSERLKDWFTAAVTSPQNLRLLNFEINPATRQEESQWLGICTTVVNTERTLRAAGMNLTEANVVCSELSDETLILMG